MKWIAMLCWCSILLNHRHQCCSSSVQSYFSLVNGNEMINDDDVNRVTVAKKSLRHSLNTNFENGSLSPWKDESGNDRVVRWIVQDFWTASPSLRPPPLEPIGSLNRKYLRLERHEHRGASFDVAVLQSPFFLCWPGDVLTFSYWIRSRYNQWNNIQVFWSAMDDAAEKLFVDLSTSAIVTINNNNNKNNTWNVASQSIPVESATEIQLTFYGFCATHDLDAIAIDNIGIITPGLSTVTITPSVTTSLEEINTSKTSSSTADATINTGETTETTEKQDMTGQTGGVTSTLSTREMTRDVTTGETTHEVSSGSTPITNEMTTDDGQQVTSTSEATSTDEASSTTTKLLFTCPNPDGEYFVAAGPCLPYYYRCRDGVATIEDCVQGTLFSPIIVGCVLPDLITDCSIKLKLTS